MVTPLGDCRLISLPRPILGNGGGLVVAVLADGDGRRTRIILQGSR